MNSFMDELSNKYPYLNVKKIEVYYNDNNYQMLQQYFTAYNVNEKQQGIPAVFTSTGYLIGEKPITELLEKYILENDNTVCPDTANKEVIGIVGDREASTIFGALSLTYVSNAAVTHFTNYNTFALIGVVLLIVILSIALGNDRALMFRRALAFIGGAFFIYFLYGMGLFTQLAEVSINSHYVVIAIVLILALTLTLKLMFSKKELFECKSHSAQQKLRRTVMMLICPLCTLIYGVLFGLFTLSGFHKAFGWIRFLITQDVKVPSMTIMLLYFIIIWMLVPLAITVILFLIRDKGEDAGERGMWISKRKELKALNVTLSIVALVLGILALII
jgi:hypothetical protein